MGYGVLVFFKLGFRKFGCFWFFKVAHLMDGWIEICLFLFPRFGVVGEFLKGLGYTYVNLCSSIGFLLVFFSFVFLFYFS